MGGCVGWGFFSRHLSDHLWVIKDVQGNGKERVAFVVPYKEGDGAAPAM